MTLTVDQLAILNRRCGLETLESALDIHVAGGTMTVSFSLPRAGVSLLEWKALHREKVTE